MFDWLQQEAIRGNIRFVDFYFAQHLARWEGQSHPHLLLAASLVSYRTGMGDVCLDLNSIDSAHLDIKLPEVGEWTQSLSSFGVVGKPGDIAPLILDESNRLYLGRYWWYEKQVADGLRMRSAVQNPEHYDADQLIQSLARLFPGSPGETDWQKVAAALAVLRNFVVISGGPGTGKTHTVASILALLLEQWQPRSLRIALAAPTGKAAARLSESIRRLKSSIACSGTIRMAIPENASTLHRLLGVRPGKVEPRHHAANPLNLDVLVLDEASMIDLPMMAKVLAALPEHARLILLGDKNQLASVEAGSVFADICGSGEGVAYSESCRRDLEPYIGDTVLAQAAQEGLQDHIALLQKSYRFADDQGIGQLAVAINQGDVVAAIRLLQSGVQGISLVSPVERELESKIRREVLPHLIRCRQSDDVAQALQAFGQIRMLCATWEGSCGVHRINEIVETSLRDQRMISANGEWYAGKPILITQNDYRLGLFNGDIGVLWPDAAANGQLRAWFAQEGDSLKAVLPSRLPAHETAYAMTVHKAQGSEFELVWLLLPFVDSELLSREWVYTAITRAKKQVEIWANPEVLHNAILRKTQRTSGLREQLYNKE